SRRERRAKNDGFVAAQDPFLPAPPCVGFQGAEVKSRLRLRMGKGKFAAAIEKRGQQPRLLIFPSDFRDDSAAKHHGSKIGLVHKAAAESLTEQEKIESRSAKPAVLRREGQREPAHLRKGGPDLVAAGDARLHRLR